SDVGTRFSDIYLCENSDFETDLDRIGPLAILDHFSTIYTIINYYLALEIEIRVIKDLLNEDSFGLEEKNQHKNCIKACCTFLCTAIKDRLATNKPNLIKSRGRVKKDIINTSFDQVWLNNCEKCLELFCDLFSFSFQNLWHPPILEEEFLRLIINFAIKLLENTSLSKIKHIFQSITQLIGLIVSKHNSLLGVILELLNIVQTIENQATLVCNIVCSIVIKFNCPQFIVQLFKELAHTQSKDMVADTASSRNCSQFLSALGKTLPKDVLNNSSLLMCHLERDPYPMRNAVLDCFGYVVTQIFSKMTLDDVSRKSRDTFLDKIQEHMHDFNAYVRSHVLQIWSEIAKEKSIPLSRFNALATLTVSRLNDKSCNVRKNAALLLFHLIVNNPYSPALSIKDIQNQLKIEESKCASDSTNMLIENYGQEWNTIELGFIEYHKNIETIQAETKSPSINIDVIPQTNATEIISLLIDGNYENAAKLTFDCLDLDEETALTTYSCDELLRIYKKFFFRYVSGKIIQNGKPNHEISEEDEERNVVIVNYLKDTLSFANLILSSMPIVYRLLQSDTTSDIIEIIQLIVTVSKFSILPLNEAVDHILPLIWSTEPTLKASVIEAITNVLFSSPEQGNNEIMIENLFSIIHNASVGVISAVEELISNLSEKNIFPKTLIKDLWRIFSNNDANSSQVHAITILGMIAKGQPSLITQNLEIITHSAFSKDTSIKLALASSYALLIYSNALRKNSDQVYKHKMENNNILFKKIISYISDKFDDSSSLWSPLFELSIKLIISFSNRPLILLTDISKELLNKIDFKIQDHEACSSDIRQIGRILHAISHIAVSILFLLEGDFLIEIKRRSQVVQRMSSTKTTINSSILNTSTTNADHEEEINVGGATADDTEVDLVKDLCEHEILHEENVFSSFIPLIHHIIDKNASYPVDLVVSEHENIRLNTVILIGDIIQRFPNLIEPWMPNMFSTYFFIYNHLLVRKAVLAVLSSLILNDMVKVKGHISELVLCIEDPDPVISARTRLFFHELSRKDNVIYNILPDVISRLSDARSTLDRNLFEKVMKFLLKFLQKEKQCESLVDKLCHRFSLVKNSSEVLDIVFCLSQLNMGERSFKKLIENFLFYKDKVYDDQVYDSFIVVVSKFKKSSRDEIKNIVEEFEKRLSEAHCRGLKDEKIGPSPFVKDTPTQNSSLTQQNNSTEPSPKKRRLTTNKS
ncbi:hypothetical protein HZS_6693, partial [Henneguya salminicola]